MSIKTFYKSIKDLVLGKYTFLLFSLILMIFLMPVSDASGESLISTIVMSVILIGSIYSIIQNKKFLYTSIVLVVASLVINWLQELWPHNSILHWMFLIQPIFLLYVTVLIVINMIKAENITADIILGSMCGYLLVGVTWGLFFEFLIIIEPNSFSIPIEYITDSDLYYLSFTTISTLGYGDITPKSSLAKAFCVLEAIIGLFYVSTLVARLVALQITKPRR
ncbi:MAG: potassium channel family protein [Vampirovibrionia bacterium]